MEVDQDFSPNSLYEGLFDVALGEGDGSLEEVSPSYGVLSEVATQYEELELLGKGGLKSVYKCYDHCSRRMVAYATPREGLQTCFYEVFIHEAWLTASLKHPNIIKIHEVKIDREGRPYFTMDLKGNTTLKEYVEAVHTTPEILNIFTKVCDAISYAHAKGVVHLDLKPENIQCDEYGEVLVCDWGLGKLLSAQEIEGPYELELIEAAHHTLYGDIKGSLGYMAPEQVEYGASKDQLSLSLIHI